MEKMKNKDHPLYNTWHNMRQRCLCATNRDYPCYGGRGIAIDDSWSDFWVFVNDMGVRPDGYTLDRINNDLGYNKKNCRWASKTTQKLNSRGSVKTSKFKGVCYTKGYKSKPWMATLNSMYIGRFPTEEEAAIAYDCAVIQLYEEGKLNIL